MTPEQIADAFMWIHDNVRDRPQTTAFRCLLLIEAVGTIGEVGAKTRKRLMEWARLCRWYIRDEPALAELIAQRAATSMRLLAETRRRQKNKVEEQTK